MRFHKLFPALLFLLVLSGALGAQNARGTVKSKSGETLVGAYVSHVNSDVHTHSDEFGNFLIRGVTEGDTLLISYLGFEPRKMILKALDRPVVVVLEESFIDLGQVVVRNNNRETNIVSSIDVGLRPVTNSQQILRRVPGLFIGQHAGGGKAEQIFLRGFDIDHGTDVAISVDGMPVNMVSHAHGQGYADLHFIIPETIEKIDFAKGPYAADVGNFATAGYVKFRTRDRLDNSMVSLEAGNFNSKRFTGLFNLVDTSRTSAYVAASYTATDGPFESSQNFYRNNFMGKLTHEFAGGLRVSLLASHFRSRWDASGQIPVRAVESGRISRFGAIDDTEGGQTSRTNIALEASRILDENSYLKANTYFSLYDFELFSNFTFFLEDPVNGDQIRQFEDRQLFGFESSYNRTASLGTGSALFRAGAGLRADLSNDNSLARTRARRVTLEEIQRGRIDERNFYAFADADLTFGRLSIQPGLRVDAFEFNYVDDLDTIYNLQHQTATAVSPKLSVLYDVSPGLRLFAKAGIGFHSNDTRVVLDRTARDILPAAYGADLGATFKPSRRTVANVAAWYLKLDQEFVYVGDAGIVEPSGETRRVGIDFDVRHQLNDWLFANLDVNYAYARSLEAPEGEDRIPLAADLTASGGLTASQDRWRANVQFRHLGDRAANEDNSIVAEGYTVVDASASYDIGALTLGFQIDNLLDTEWNETQFATESRLRNEVSPVEEIHFTPGTPFAFRALLKYRF